MYPPTRTLVLSPAPTNAAGVPVGETSPLPPCTPAPIDPPLLAAAPPTDDDGAVIELRKGPRKLYPPINNLRRPLPTTPQEREVVVRKTRLVQHITTSVFHLGSQEDFTPTKLDELTDEILLDPHYLPPELIGRRAGAAAAGSGRRALRRSALRGSKAMDILDADLLARDLGCAEEGDEDGDRGSDGEDGEGGRGGEGRRLRRRVLDEGDDDEEEGEAAVEEEEVEEEEEEYPEDDDYMRGNHFDDDEEYGDDGDDGGGEEGVLY